jgi:UDP-N-acetyl-D-glucosamine dehydrogenase
MHSICWDENKLQEYDLAIIATDHTDISWQNLVENVPLIIDTRNVMRGIKSKNCVIIKS